MQGTFYKLMPKMGVVMCKKYGNDVLLYIGKAETQTFAKRLSQEAWEMNPDSENLKFYVGRLFDEEHVKSIDAWNQLINRTEKMLIYSHEPARNSSTILTIIQDTKILESHGLAYLKILRESSL